MGHFEYQNGFSLIEIIVAIMVVGIIATLSIVAMGDVTDRAIIETTIQEARKFQAAATTFQALNGRWPDDAQPAIIPKDLAGYLSERDFSRTPPCGGKWDWNGPNTSFNKFGVAIVFEASEYSRQFCQDVDAAVDDGNLRKGSVYLFGELDQSKNGKRHLQFHLDDK